MWLVHLGGGEFSEAADFLFHCMCPTFRDGLRLLFPTLVYLQDGDF